MYLRAIAGLTTIVGALSAAFVKMKKKLNMSSAVSDITQEINDKITDVGDISDVSTQITIWFYL